MRPQPFVDLLKGWVEAAGHPAVAKVQTCAEIGRHEQPAGLAVALTDGWTFLLQTVRASPPGGDTDNPADHGWDEVAYRQARIAAEKAAATVPAPPRGAKPQARAVDLLAVLLDAVKRADHPGIISVEVSARTPADREVLRMSCVDGSTIFGLPVGFIPPGSTDLAHQPHAIPKEIF